MTIARLKDFTYNTLVPQGYQMVFEQPTVQELDTLIEIANSAKGELLVANNVLQDFEDKERMEFLLFKLDKIIKCGESWEYKWNISETLRYKMSSLSPFVWDASWSGARQNILEYHLAAKRHIEGM